MDTLGARFLFDAAQVAAEERDADNFRGRGVILGLVHSGLVAPALGLGEVGIGDRVVQFAADAAARGAAMSTGSTAPAIVLVLKGHLRTASRRGRSGSA